MRLYNLALMIFLAGLATPAFADPVNGGAANSGETQLSPPPSTAPAQQEQTNSKSLNSCTAQNAFELGTEEKVLAWERWHKHVGKAIGKRINAAVGVALGSVVLQVKINKDRSLDVEMLSGSDKLGPAALKAVQELSGDKVLQFPDESKRENVSFNYEYKRGFFVLPLHRFIKDDFEHMDN